MSHKMRASAWTPCRQPECYNALMFALVKPLLIALAVIGVLLYVLGVISYDKPDYACFRGRSLRFDERVEVARIGSLALNTYPLRHDCPEDERYDPAEYERCGFQTFCPRSSYEKR